MGGLGLTLYYILIMIHLPHQATVLPPQSSVLDREKVERDMMTDRKALRKKKESGILKFEWGSEGKLTYCLLTRNNLITTFQLSWGRFCIELENIRISF